MNRHCHINHHTKDEYVSPENIKLIAPNSTFLCSFAGNPLSDRICTRVPFPKVLFATFRNAAGELNSIFGQHLSCAPVKLIFIFGSYSKADVWIYLTLPRFWVAASLKTWGHWFFLLLLAIWHLGAIKEFYFTPLHSRTWVMQSGSGLI